MKYDPIKDGISTYVDIFPCFRSFFYKLLDFFLLRQSYVKQAILAHFRDGQSFYDAGAGFCQYSHFVLNKYPHSKVFAADLKDTYLESYANVAGPRFSFQKADLQYFVPARKYNMAIAIDILEHIEDDLSTLYNFYNALEDSGILIISTPSDLDEAARFTAEHVRPGYNKQELEDKLMRSGFEILTSGYSYGFWGSLSWKLLIRTPLNLLSKNKASILILPIYLMLTMLPARLMMRLDTHQSKSWGTGIIITARKKH